MRHDASEARPDRCVVAAALGAQQSARPSPTRPSAATWPRCATLLKQGADVNARAGRRHDRAALGRRARRRRAGRHAALRRRQHRRGDAHRPVHAAAPRRQGRQRRRRQGAAQGRRRRRTRSSTNSGATAAAPGGRVRQRRGRSTCSLDAKADVNAKETEGGQTPLIFAAGRTASTPSRRCSSAAPMPAHHDQGDRRRRSNALDRAAADRQRKVLEGFVGKESEAKADAEPGAGRGPGRPRDRPLRQDSAARSERAGSNPNARNFNPEEINPPVADQGRHDRAAPRRAPGLHRGRRALLDGGADIDQQGRRRHHAAADRDHQRPVRHRDAADRARRQPEPRRQEHGATPLWAAINTQWQPRTRFPQPQEMELQKATYLEVMEALLDKGADRTQRLSSHPWYMVYTGCGNRNCGLAEPRARRRSGAPPTRRTSTR